MGNTFCSKELKDMRKAKKLLQQVWDSNCCYNRDTQTLWQIINDLTELLKWDK